jgi:hypothetical protein
MDDSPVAVIAPSSIDVDAEGLEQTPDEEGLEEEEIDLSLQYWATWPQDKLLPQLKAKEDTYFDVIQRLGFGSAWLGAYAAYHGQDPDALGTWASQNIGLDGDEGELLRFRINEARSYINQGITMAIGKRPAFQALAENNDYDTLAGIESADAAIGHFYWKNYGERKERRTVVKGDLYGLSWTWVVYDPKGGPLVDRPVPLPPEMGGGPSPTTQQVPRGEMIIKSKAPWEVFGEPYIEEHDEHVWRCVRDKTSKWEVIAKLVKTDEDYEEKRKKIAAMSCKDEHAIELFFGMDVNAVNGDEIIVKHFYHAKTRACPTGRYLIYVEDIVIYDGPLPYESLPLADYCPSEYLGTAFGYADSWDLIPLNQMLDQIISDIATNLSTFGRQTLFGEEGVDLDPQQIADGVNYIALPPGTAIPQAAVYAEVPEGAKWMLEYLERRFQSLTGQNGVTRGDTAQMPSSGTLAALYHTVALEANSAKQIAVDMHRERVANLLLVLIKDFEDIPLIMQVVGEDERPYLMPVDGKIFKGVHSIVLKSAEPMLKTQAGRSEIADKILAIPQIVESLNPQQIIELYVSGQFKPTYKAPRSAMLRISWENKQLAKGPKVQMVPDAENPVNPDGTPRTYESLQHAVPVLATDDPEKHILEHLSVLAAESAIMNTDIVSAVLAHVYDHVRTWKSMDPALAALLKIPPPPPDPVIAAMMQTQQSQVESRKKPGQLSDGKTPGMKPADAGMDTTGVKLPKPAESPVPPQM